MLGYVLLTIRGVTLDWLLNACDQENIRLYSVKRVSRTEIHARVRMRRYQRLCELAKEMGCKVEPKKRAGVPFFIQRVRRRRAFLIGGILFVLSVVVLTQFVWSIQIVGVNESAAQNLKVQLQDKGIDAGTPWQKVDLNGIENELMMDNDWAAYIIAQKRGVSLVVEAVPITTAPKEEQKDAPCDIVATTDGVIQQLKPLEGVRMVQEGDIVEKGDVLISGTIARQEGEDGEDREVCARGEVLAKVWYTAQASASMEQEVAKETGRTAVQRTLTLGGWTIALDGAPEDFSDTIVKEEKEYPIIGLFLPATMQVKTIAEVNRIMEPISYEKAETIAKQKAEEEIKKIVPDGIQITNLSYTCQQEDEKSLSVKVYAETIQDIGVPRYYE